MFYSYETLANSFGATTEKQIVAFIQDYVRMHPTCTVKFKENAGIELSCGAEQLKPVTKNGLEQLSGGFVQGYTKAIMDLQEVLREVQWNLYLNRKCLTAKRCHRVLELCLIHRADLREDMGGLIIWNPRKEDFEFYNPSKKGE